MEEVVVACHCSTCRGEVYQTIRTCQRHVTLYGTLNEESTDSQTSFSESEQEEEGEVCDCLVCKGDVIVSHRTRQRHGKYHDIRSPASDGKQPDTSDSESMDWDVSSNANEDSLACDEVESNDESSEDEEQSESDTETYQTSEPICENSPVTQMDVAVALLRWFSKYPGVSKAAVGDLLSLLQGLMSLAVGKRVKFPNTFKKARALLNNYITETKQYQICSNECILYAGENNYATECPTCGEERYAGDSPVRTFSVIPLIPRLKKVFQSPNLARLLKYHAVRQQEREEEDLVFDVQDTQFWRRMYSENGPLDGDPRNLLLSFSADPVHPFKTTNSQYSMCPISLQILNFPKPLRSADDRMLLWSVLPGPKKPKSLSTYLGPLVDELLQLEEGVECYDSDTREHFKLKARCVLDILDYEGQQMFLNTLGQNAFQGCNKCRQPGTYLPILEKMVYTDSRRFLAINHPLRSESGPIFPHVGEETRPPPEGRRQCQQHQYGVAYERAKANGASNTALRAMAKSTGVKGLPAFDRLPYFDAITDVVTEPMHMIARIGLLLVKLLTGVAPMDSWKVRVQEEEFGRFGEACQLPEDDNNSLPEAPWSLSKEDACTADTRRGQALAPVGIGFRNVKMFTSQTNLISHDWFQAFSSGILKYCLRGMLGDVQRHALFAFIDVVSSLQRPAPAARRKNDVENIQETLSRMEMAFPVSIQVIILHLFQHLPTFIERFGDVYSISMFPSERYQHFLVSRVKNKRYPEACVMETYKVLEATETVLNGENVHEEFREILQEDSSSIASTRSFAKYVTTRSDVTCTFAGKTKVNLNRRRHQQLIAHYQQSIPEYDELLKLYKNYQESERRRGRIPSSMANWVPPTALTNKYGEEVISDLLAGPSTLGEKRTKATLVDKERGMLIHLRCSEEEEIYFRRRTRSSFIKAEFVETEPTTERHYIGETPDGEEKFIYFGRIEHFFVQEFAGETRELAYVNWFKPPFFEEDVNMWRIDTSLGFYNWLPYVFVKDIESQVIVAKDGNSIWILSPV